MATFDEVISGAQGSAAWRHWVQFAEEPLTAPNRVPGLPPELRLAAEMPTQASGKWVINPDGTMDMTWKLVPNAKWHDGVPVTAADIAFTFQLRTDPAVMKATLGGGLQYIKSIEVIDPYTFTTHWKQSTLQGRNGDGLTPLPKHLWDPIYKQDPTLLQYTTLNTSEYVGAGPFKLVRYEPAQFIEFRRFDDYHKGPAKVDRVILRTIYDVNTAFANLLAGAADVLTPPGIGLEEAADLRDRGAVVVIGERNHSNNYEIQHDLTYARPTNAVNPLVRQAGLIAINRQELADVMQLGQGRVAFINDHPSDDNYQLVGDWVESPDFPYQYPYDPRKAQQLLEQAGWTKGTDGILVHSPSGERFDYEVMFRAGSSWAKGNSIIQQYLKAVGINLTLYTLTGPQVDDNKFLSQKSGASNQIAGPSIGSRRFHSANIATEANNWTGGNNRGRYSDPAMDKLIETIEVTVRDTELRVFARQYIDKTMSGVDYWPFYYEPVPYVTAKGITGVLPSGGQQNWWWDLDKN